MIVSVPAPPPMEARPPPCPACNSTAVASISASRMRIPIRIPYMRRARYLGDGGAHKLRPVARVQRRAADQHAVQLVLGQQLRGVLQVHAAAVENHERRGGNRVVFQPAANRPVDLRGVLRRGVSSRADRPHGLIRNRHARLAVALAQRDLELPRHDLQHVPGLALLERLTDAEHRLQVGRERRSDFFFGVGVRLAEDVTTLGVADQSESGAALFGERSGGGSGERAFGLPMEVLRSDRDVAVTRDSLRDRLDRHGRWEEPHRPLVRDLPRRKKSPQVLAGLDGTDVHLPVAGEHERSHAFSSAATPGSSLPSRNSSEAPPPVDTWVSRSSMPATAATESPPPTTVTAPFLPASTSAVATARVPASNGGVSNTPIGPFQKMVLPRSSRAR